MSAMKVRVAYRGVPSHDTRLSEEERQNSVTVLIPATGLGDGRVGVPAVRLVEAARRQLQIEGTTLQLSLHGLVLSPEEDVVDLLDSLPQGTRDRMVFLLSPGAIEQVTEEREKDKEKEDVSGTRRMAFAARLLSSRPTAEATTTTTATTAPVDHMTMTNPRPGGPPCDVRKCNMEPEKSLPQQCVFRESWLNPIRCVRCHRMRRQHSVFSPTSEERMQRAMTPPKGKSKWQLPSAPSPREHHICNEQPSPGEQHMKSVVVVVGGAAAAAAEQDFGSLGMPYYADPRQWLPKRSERYHAPSADACADFFASWGNPMLCARCQRTRDFHKPDAIRSTPDSTLASPRRNRHAGASPENTNDAAPSPRRARRACENFIPLWDNNEYCSTCYTRKESHMIRAQKRSPRHRATSSRHLLSPPCMKAASVGDWLATCEFGRSVPSKRGVRRGQTAIRAVRRARGTEGVHGVVGVSAAAPPSSVLPLRSCRSSSSSSSSSTALPTPQKVLVFSGPPSVGVNSAAPTRPTTPTRRRVWGGFSPHDIPWAVVLRYTTMEGLLVCKDVCATMRAAAVPLIFANCRYIMDTLDVPLQTRDVLVQCADLYASAIVAALRQKTTRCGPAYAATRPLRLLQYCILQLFQALRAVESVEIEKPMARDARRRHRASMTSPRCLAAVSPVEAAVAIAAKGVEACEEELAKGCIAKGGDDDVDTVRSMICSVARCDPALLSQVAINCIADAFEAISLAAAASLVHFSDDGQKDTLNRRVKHVRLLSLGEFFDEHAFMPLVNFLHAIEVVARMKWMAQVCLEKLHCHPSLYCSAG